MERLPSGLERYGALAGMHDDTVMALALAWYASTNEPGWLAWMRKDTERMRAEQALQVAQPRPVWEL